MSREQKSVEPLQGHYRSPGLATERLRSCARVAS